VKKIINVLLILWIVLAIFNIAYNSIKTVPEFNEWAPLSDTQKRQKIYGDFYTFLLLVKNNTQSNDEIFIYNNDSDKWKTFFQSVYYLYPRKITSTIDAIEFKKQITSKRFIYVAAFNSPIESRDYQKIASFSAGKNYGSINKLNE
jgi:hypothetical protein